MRYHLRLIKGLSYSTYDGALRATAAHPDVFTDDEEKYKAALKSGYFRAIQAAPAATEEAAGEKPDTIKGHLDPVQFETMTEEQLKKLAADMGLDVVAQDKEALVKAIAAEEVEAEATEEAEDLSKMTVDKLREYAKENDIALTGCNTKTEILQKIREEEADRAAAGLILAGGDQ